MEDKQVGIYTHRPDFLGGGAHNLEDLEDLIPRPVAVDMPPGQERRPL